MLPPSFGRLLHSAAPSRRRRRRLPAPENPLGISDKPKSPVFGGEVRSPKGEDVGVTPGGANGQALSGVNPEGSSRKKFLARVEVCVRGIPNGGNSKANRTGKLRSSLGGVVGGKEWLGLQKNAVETKEKCMRRKQIEQ